MLESTAESASRDSFPSTVSIVMELQNLLQVGVALSVVSQLFFFFRVLWLSSFLSFTINFRLQQLEEDQKGFEKKSERQQEAPTKEAKKGSKKEAKIEAKKEESVFVYRLEFTDPMYYTHELSYFARTLQWLPGVIYGGSWKNDLSPKSETTLFIDSASYSSVFNFYIVSTASIKWVSKMLSVVVHWWFHDHCIFIYLFKFIELQDYFKSFSPWNEAQNPNIRVQF